MMHLSFTILRLPYKKIAKQLFLFIIVFFLFSPFADSQSKKDRDKSEKPFTHKYAYLQNSKAWKHVGTILNKIKRPLFKSALFNIKDFGAIANDTLNDRLAIEKAIAACFKAGGGKVIVPAGIYISNGPVHLKSNINLHLEKGAEIIFGTKPKDYEPLVKVRWEGTFCYNYSPLIYAYKQKNIAVTGEGILNGQAEKFWYKWKKQADGNDQEKDKTILRQMGNDKVPLDKRIFGGGFYLSKNGVNMGDGQQHYLRPTLIEFVECANILLENITCKGSPFWTVHPVLCTNITINALHIQRGVTNDDGIDPDGCKNVLIENCIINTQDDCIAIKAGRDQDAWDKPASENIIIRNCKLNTEIGSSFCIGSEMSACVKNIFIENCILNSDSYAIRFKSNRDRGGIINNIYIRKIQVDSCKYAIAFTNDYHGWRGNNFPTRFTNLYVSNINVAYCKETAVQIIGLKEQPIKRIWINKAIFKGAKRKTDIQFTKDVILEAVVF